MPDNIAQYTSPIDKLQPSETGAETLARMGRVEKENDDEAGRAIGGVVKEAGAAVDNYEYMQEVSQGAAALAVMHNTMTTAWNKQAAATDPNDTTIQQKFMDSAQQQIEDWKGSFSTKRGQEWAMNQADSLQNHLWEKTSADMGARAGNAVIGNLKTTLNSLSDTARQDPTTIDHALGQVDALVGASKEAHSGILDAQELNRIDDVSADMKNEIVKAGVMGLADKNPDAAVKLVNSGSLSPYMKPTEAEELNKYAEGVTRMRYEDQQRAYEQQKRAQDMKDENFFNQTLNQIKADPNGNINIPSNINQQIWNSEGVSAKTKLSLMGGIKHLSQDTAEDDPNVIRDFTQRLKDDSPNPLSHDDLLDAYGSGKLTQSQFELFDRLNKNTVEMNMAKKDLNKAIDSADSVIKGPNLGTGTDLATAQASARLRAYATQTVAATLANPPADLKGMTQGQIISDLSNPASKHYMFTDEVMAGFKPNGDDAVKSGGWFNWFSSNKKTPTAQTPASPPPTPLNVPAPGTPERAEWVRKQLLGNGGSTK